MKRIDLSFLAKVSTLQSTLDKAFFSKRMGFSAVRLLFLKYCVDNFMCAETKEDVQAYARVQKMFAARDIEGGPNILVPILNLIDNHYNLNGLIKDSIHDYAKELFGLDDEWKRKNVSLKDLKEIMGSLSDIDLTEESGSSDKRHQLVNCLATEIYNRSENNRFVSCLMSKIDLSHIAYDILDVQKNETFLDFVSGIGLSTLNIIRDRQCKVVNYDINKDSLCIAAMFYILHDMKDFSLNQSDSLSEGVNCSADKIFIDPPLGIKINNVEKGTLDAPVRAVQLVLENLREEGKAVICVPSSVLFSEGKSISELKQQLMNCNYLSAVISLPISWYGTVICINLLIIEKKKSEQVLFVNFAGKSTRQYVKKEKQGYSLTTEGKQKLVNVINNRELIEGISVLVDKQTIAVNNFDLQPIRYIREFIDEESLSLDEINKRLNELYKELSQII